MAILRVGLGHDQDASVAASVAMELTPKPDLVICFVSFSLDVEKAYSEIRSVVGDAVPIVGGSSWGEISSLKQGPQEASVVVMTLQSAYFSVGLGVGQNLSKHPEQAAKDAIREAYSNLLSNPAVMSLMAIALDSKGAKEVSRIKPCINMVLPDGTSAQEEAFLRSLILETGTVSQVIGGSTATDFSDAKSYQISNGVHQDSAVVASFSSGLKIGTAMGHPYVAANKGAVVTQAKGRTVQMLNGKPATEVLQKLLGGEELTPELFIQNPFGIKSSDVFAEYTIKSAQQVHDDGGVSFYAEIPKGAFLREMKTDADIARERFKETLQKAIIDAGSPKKIGAVIIFNCILRHLLKARLDVDDICLVKEVCGEDVPVIGFNTFGEQGATQGGSIGHYNQTATIMVIGEEVITQ
ncbi:FIST signal transduction protein [Neptuniibacter sp. PT34_22]|uniref:FIST signal transduction protein n=1 Tax=Neptuniibacter sp. PT34_22 TaxID=3398205 RepID=UPI0039F59418